MGNAEIIEFLYRHHYKYVFMVAFNICDRWDMAEDIVQDGFIKILGSKEVFFDWRHGRKYLTGCIKNACFERLNKEGRIMAARKDFLLNDAPDDSYRASLGSKLVAGISKIKSAMSQTVIREIYLHNRTRQEVGQLYEISRKTVGRQEQQGLYELKKLYIP